MYSFGSGGEIYGSHSGAYRFIYTVVTDVLLYDEQPQR